MWEIDLTEQVYTLLDSLMTGAVLCLVLDVYFALCNRIHFGKLTLFVSDIVLFSLIGVFDFLLFLAHCNGEIRLYVFLCQLTGFYLCRKTLSRLFRWALNAIFNIVNLFYRFAERRVFNPMILLFEKILKKIGFMARKYAFFIKKRLKKPDRLVYTKVNCQKNENGKEAE